MKTIDLQQSETGLLSNRSNFVLTHRTPIKNLHNSSKLNLKIKVYYRKLNSSYWQRII